MVKIKVKRIAFKDTYTIGKLYIDDVYFCDTLEDKYRDLSKEDKVFGETAIPTGEYKMIITYSNRFKIDMPLILNVPNFDGIRIHAGNEAVDTHGCILVGENKFKGKVVNSKYTYNKLYSMLIATGQKDFDFSIL